MRRAVLFLAAIVSLAGCNSYEPEAREVSKNGREAELLATVDGCRIWRLSVSAQSVFFARCPEGAADVIGTRTRLVGKVIVTETSQSTIGMR